MATDYQRRLIPATRPTAGDPPETRFWKSFKVGSEAPPAARYAGAPLLAVGFWTMDRD